MLLSVLHPAPVTTTSRRELCTSSASRCSWGSVRGGAGGAVGTPAAAPAAGACGRGCCAVTSSPSRVMRSCSGAGWVECCMAVRAALVHGRANPATPPACYLPATLPAHLAKGRLACHCSHKATALPGLQRRIRPHPPPPQLRAAVQHLARVEHVACVLRQGPQHGRSVSDVHQSDQSCERGREFHRFTAPQHAPAPFEPRQCTPAVEEVCVVNFAHQSRFIASQRPDQPTGAPPIELIRAPGASPRSSAGR